MGSGHTKDLTNGSVSKKLISFMLPLLITNILQQLYNSADKAVVGQFSGKIALAAVGSTGSATTMILNLLYGLAAGASIMNANLLGSRKNEELRRSMHSSIVLGALGGLFMSAVGLLATKPLLRLMSCPESVINSAALYMRIFFCGVPGSFLYNFGAGILRVHGDSRRPMYILAVTGLINVMLNLVFVIGFRMDVAGVAIATIISQYISAIWVVKILFDRKDQYGLRFRELKAHKQECMAIIRVGLPCGFSGLSFSLSNMVVQSTINSFGDTVIAGNAASDSLIAIYNQFPTAFYTACMNFAGQCYGAGKYKRINDLMRTSAVISTAVMTLLAVVSTIFSDLLLGVFNTDPLVIDAGRAKLLLVSWSYIIFSISELLMGCLRGMQKTTIPSMISIGGICLARVLWVWLVTPADPTNTVLLYWCFPVSYVLSCSLMLLYYFQCRKKLPLETDVSLA